MARTVLQILEIWLKSILYLNIDIIKDRRSKEISNYKEMNTRRPPKLDISDWDSGIQFVTTQVKVAYQT